MESMSSVFICPFCSKPCKSSGGRTQHINSVHRQITPDTEPDASTSFTTVFHPYLTALPCDEDGNFLPPFSQPSMPRHNNNANPWHPFEDRLAFDWASYHFVDMQSSESRVNTGLDLWLAAIIKAGSPDGVPWSSVEELYSTIDSIQQGHTPWRTFSFKYNGPRPVNPPKWMLESYELCTRDSRLVIHEQMGTSDFDSRINYVPYQQFNGSGDRVWSNLMSGDWANHQADKISEDPATHGAMFVPIVAGSDKTTVSVATGHQEYHPVYIGPGNVTNEARRAHGNAVLPVAFLPIPKASKRQRNKPVFQQFCRQLYHACLTRIFMPLKAGMTTPDIIRCPDGHYRKAIYGLGPYIADYPEQVWLAGIVQGWCPKCDAKPEDLDNLTARRRTHEKTDFLLQSFDPGIVWDDYGIRSDVVPFTHGFPRADIHELLSPDLLHQIIKGTFKDHLVTWVNEYFVIKFGESRALAAIQDIDRRISAVPIYPGLRRFPDGRDFAQWTGDDSKALMKVYLAAIAGHVPSKMVQCISAFMEMCYIARRNAITRVDLERFEEELRRFHELRSIFIEEGVRADTSLPRQHALSHYARSIILFGSPNGLCSSITESKHIKAVKEPWRRSNRYQALSQMLVTLTRLDKLAALHSLFTRKGMMYGTTSSYIAGLREDKDLEDDNHTLSDKEDGDNDDAGPAPGPRALSSVDLGSRPQSNYPKTLTALAAYIHQPGLPLALKKFIYLQQNPDAAELPASPTDYPEFWGTIHVYHSAVARFYAPSDLCGAGGMHREIIRATPTWKGHPRNDTVFVVTDEEQTGMRGMVIARVLLFFTFNEARLGKNIPCALVNWFVHSGQGPDKDTGMWVVQPEKESGIQTLEVIHLDSIARGAHLLPIFGSGYIPEDFKHIYALDSFKSYFVNKYIDHHGHEFLAESQYVT